MENVNQGNSILNPIDQVTGSPRVNSETYGFVSTRAMLDVFGAHGWTPVKTAIAKTRNPDNVGFQKHLITLENPAFQSIEGLTDSNNSRPQLALLGSHDGTTALQLFWGLLRVACLNGIIAGTALSSFRLIHSKRITDRLPEAIEYMIGNLPAFIDQIKMLQGLKFSDVALAEFTRTVYDARLKGVGKVLDVDYSLPRPMRIQDTENDAFTVFNRIQERLIRGGIKYRAERNRLDDAGNIIETRIIDTKTRKLSSVTQQVSLNRLVYDAALKLAA